VSKTNYTGKITIEFINIDSIFRIQPINHDLTMLEESYYNMNVAL